MEGEEGKGGKGGGAVPSATLLLKKSKEEPCDSAPSAARIAPPRSKKKPVQSLRDLGGAVTAFFQPWDLGGAWDLGAGIRKVDDV